MAVTTSSKLVLGFIDEDEKAMSVTLNNAKSDATAAAVRNLMDTMIDKAAAFQRPPYQKTSAKMVTTTETDIEIEE